MRITDLLRTIDLFERLSFDDLDQLSRRMQDRHLSPGEVAFRQGEQALAMYVVLAGCVELTTAGPDGRPPSKRQLSSGESFGEVALISGEVHQSTAAAVVESRVLELHRDDFEALVSTRPQLMRIMLAAVSRQAVQANRRLLAEQPNSSLGTSSGRVYPVFSPRGGAGKTTVAVRLAMRLAELIPRQVALLDLDLLFADTALELNLTPPSSLARIPEEELEHLDPRTLSGCLAEHPNSLRIVVGATSPEEGERVTAAHVRAALTALKRQFLITVVDCRGSFSEPTLVALEMGDRVLVLCTPELASLRDVRDCQRVFGQALHLEKSRLSYVFNHPLPSAGLTRLQFESALEESMSLEIPHAGESATKPGFAKAIDQLARELRPPESASIGSQARQGVAATPAAASGGKRLLRLWHKT
jgi:CRP-like cAMP-binding protein